MSALSSRPGGGKGRRRTLLGAALASTLLLIGCAADGDSYDDQTGQPVGTNPALTSKPWGCDPNGFGPLSGCDTPGTEPAPDVEIGCDPSGWGPFSGCDTASESGEPSAFGPGDGVDQDMFALHARHEAGHKAVADEYGWVASVRLNQDGSGSCTVLFLRLKDPRQRLAFLYAGVAAAPGTDYAAAEDYADAEDILSDLPEPEQAATEDAARAEAERIVAERAAEIDRDTTILLDRGHL